ncbi:MAG: glucose 1-dehydrogenase [Cyclobacteriaceae bacterium]|jgi:dehydrogenase/reductase SDR family member 4|nr:glucose 1-dehydrogenase [Cyclobacteriaceae bacterium]
MEEFSLKNKVAIVTGASKGIGRAIAELYAEYGAKVVVSSRKQEGINEVVEAIIKKGQMAIGISANTGKSDDLQNLVSSTIDQYGRIDILVNNAATNPTFGPLVNTNGDAFDHIMNINLKGPFELAKLVLPSMADNGGGSIINISSIGGISPEPLLGIYSVSKAALISLTKVMAKEFGNAGVRANVICPGLIKTKFSEALWSNEDATQKLVKRLPIARIGTPEDISGLALFLASEASAYTTGGVFTADGGYTI